MFKKLSLALLLFVLTTNTSCANGINQQKDISVSKEKSLNLKGKVVFPDGFKTKAEYISTLSTVSIIYPANDPTNPNKTIATGVTDNNGYFSINPSPTFIPQNNQIFVVEAIKRLYQGSNNNSKYSNLQSLRSFIRWNGSKWDSITSNDLVIDTITTGISILSSYTNTSPNDTINKVNNGSPSVIGSISIDRINRLSDMVRVCLNENRDPYASIKLIDNEYYIDRNYDVGKLLTSDDLSGLSLSYTNLAGANLSGKNLSGMDLTGINLSGANLNRCNLAGTNLTYADLSHSTLFNTILSNSLLNYSNFSHTDLTRANLDNIELNNINMSYCILSGFIFDGDGEKMSNIDLSYSDISFTTFKNISIFDINIKGSNLSHSNLSNLDLSNKDLSNTILIYTDLRNTKIYGSNLSYSNLSKQDLSGKDLSNINFEGANLSQTDLSNTILTNVNFKNSNLSSSYLENLDLSKKDLTSVDFSKSSLFHSNLEQTILIDSKLSKAKWFDGRICAEDSIGQCN
ncbi:MAG: pentapeptide repeat-containing protein [Candidatus Sericytochromatia bacterium]